MTRYKICKKIFHFLSTQMNTLRGHFDTVLWGMQECWKHTICVAMLDSERMFTSICVANGSVKRLSTRATAWCGTQSLARRKSKPSEGDRNRGNRWRAAQGLEMLEIIFRLLNIFLRIHSNYRQHTTTLTLSWSLLYPTATKTYNAPTS